MTPKAIFLDVDGTYASHGIPPDGHIKAVRAARAAGHRVFLCTGRSRAMVSAPLLSAGFDGIVGSAGAYAEMAGEVLLDRRFPRTIARKAVSVLDDCAADYILEAPGALYGYPGIDTIFRSVLASKQDVSESVLTEQVAGILAGLQMSDDLSGCSFAKITVIRTATPGPQIAQMIGSEVAVIPSSIPEVGHSGGEIYLQGVDKSLGVKAVCSRLGLDKQDVVAAGDGLNDLEMLEFAGTSIVIEGAEPQLLAHADLVAPGPQSEGLAAAFAELGLL